MGDDVSLQTATYTFIGTTDDITVCDCCGKSNLKRTVVLRDAEGNVVNYGVNCAAKAMQQQTGVKRSTAAVNAQVDAVAYAQRLIGKYTLAQTADAVWNRYGFSTSTRGGVLKIGTFAEVVCHA